MNSVEVSSAYIKKLNHPMKEIRERSLQLLMNKLQLGWGLEDELAGTRELLESLLAWFNVQQPTFQKEALELLLKTLKTKAGTYIVKEIGIEKILKILNKIKPKIVLDATEVFDDLIDTLRFLNTVDSEVNVGVPPLNLHSQTSSESNGSSSGYYNVGLNTGLSKESSVSNEDIEIKRISSASNTGINVLLFPWVNICPSDLKTMILIEDSLKVLKSTRRCCRFIRHVFLRDFPAEIFLNRPAILKTLLAIADGQYGGNPGEALNVLLSITQSLNTRFLKLFSLDLISQTCKQSVDQTESYDNVNIELQDFAGENAILPPDDGLVALRQMPAPVYALDALHTVLTVMTRSVVLDDEEDQLMDMKDLNTCLSLTEKLVELLLKCVKEQFWCVEHTSKIHRDIAHKACMVMRMMGELLTKYRSSFYKDPERAHYRVAWLRLVACGVMLLNWAKMSPLPPSSLVTALQVAQIDPAIELLYPPLGKRIAALLLSAKSSVDQEYKTKYRELNKLFVSMDHAVQFMKLQEGGRVTKNILTCIRNSLPVLHLNLNQNFLTDIAMILLRKSKDFDMSDSDWSTARTIALTLMAHSVEWVRVTFYKLLCDMVKSVLMSEESDQLENEKCLTLVSDVGILTEICCHGLSSNQREVECSSSEIMLYLLRGRMVLSEACWWRLLASLLPVLPLLHVYAEHDTQLGKAICKSLEPDIVECMGVSRSEMVAGLVRLVFVNCPAVALDAVHSLCQLLDDSRYLPPRESLRTDILLNALRRVETQDFNIDQSSSPSKNTQTSGVVQILDVLKQDLVLDEDTSEYVSQIHPTQPTLEPSLRRSTLQQLAVLLRQQELHETFLQYDGLKLIVTLLRLSLMVDDYLAFPECAISCVSVLNSICFTARHSLAKITDLPLLLLRVILVFPANENTVLMAAQVLSLVAWAGFALQELDANRRRVPALPLSVTQRTSLPFTVNSYWATSPNTEHSSVEWLLSEELWRNAVRVRWWWVCGGGARLLRSSTPLSPVSPPPLNELAALRSACLRFSCSKHLLALENATTHAQVTKALHLLESYTHLVQISPANAKELGSLPWQHTKRFLNAPPASSRDIALLISLLQFIIAYMDNVPREENNTMSWIKLSFIGNDATIISLLSRDRLYPQQTLQEDIELTQLRIHIVKVLVRCILLIEHQGEYSCSKMESLLKILLTCLERIDLKNFHVLGYLNELIRCIRYAIHSRYCKLSEDSLIQSLKVMTYALSGCASGAGRKGQACRLDAVLSLLALLKQIREHSVPVQRWSEVWDGHVVRAVVRCSSGDGAELRAAALHLIASLTQYTQLMPQLVQCVPKESLAQYGIEIFSHEGEANVVRAAAACLLTALTARTSSHTQVLERELLQAMDEGQFIEECLHIFVDFCNETTENKNYIEPNVPLSVLERRSELEVRAHKSDEINLSPSLQFHKPPPTASLVATLADVLHNVIAYKSAPVQAWNERSLYRVLFRCSSWSRGVPSEVRTVHASACRALAAAASVKCVRASLAGTRDCLYNLLVTLTPDEEDYDIEWLASRAQGLCLLAALLPERSASDVVWWELKKHSTLLDLLLHALEIEHQDLQETAIHCLTQLTRSISHKRHKDNTKEESCIDFLNNLKSPYLKRQTAKFSSGDSARADCQPEYMVEEICKVLIDIYRHCMENKKCLSSQDEKWVKVCSCLCSLLAVSARARAYCVHRHLAGTLLHSLQALRDALSLQAKPADVIKNADHVSSLFLKQHEFIGLEWSGVWSIEKTMKKWMRVCLCSLLSVSARARSYCVHRHLAGALLHSLQAFRDALSLQAKPVDVIRNADHEPILHTLNWVLTLTTCLMLECAAAKERIAEDIASSLVRLWPWCMLTEPLRDAIMRLLVTFTNDCPRAWAAMCSCVGGRSLLHEVCSLVDKEAARPRPSAVLQLSLRIMRQCVPHHHCRTIIIKNEVLSCICKLRARGGGHACAAGEEWRRLCEAMARRADGAAAVLATVGLPALKPTPARLLPALAHAAHHQRLTFLQSADLLELLSGCLLTGDTAEIVSAARAVWALAANNHRAKLVLRSAGITSAVQSTLQRLQKHSHDPSVQRAIELLTYTQTVLQTT